VDVETLARFRSEVLQLYRKFEEDLAALCQQYKFEINMWYSPSNIPQPNFRAGEVLFDVDQLYNSGEFKEIVGQYSSRGEVSDFLKKLGEGHSPPISDGLGRDMSQGKDVRSRSQASRMPYDASILDFGQRNLDLRRRRSARRNRDL